MKKEQCPRSKQEEQNEQKTEIPELTGAYLDGKRGTLKVTDIDPAEYSNTLSILAPGVYHLYDYQFFYRNLQKNVQTRIDAYLSTHLAQKRL